MDVSFLTNPMLKELFLHGVEELKQTEPGRRTRMLQHLTKLSAEMDRREI